jgi:hypothetical protein
MTRAHLLELLAGAALAALVVVGIVVRWGMP